MRFPGARLEPKGLALAVHYRGLPGARVGPLRRLVRAVARGARLGIIPGKRVWDLVPPGRPGKAAAARRLLEDARDRAGGQRVRSVYVGDDATDAEVFRTLGRRLVGIQVGGRRGAAAYRVPDVAAVHAWLACLAAASGPRANR